MKEGRGIKEAVWVVQSVVPVGVYLFCPSWRWVMAGLFFLGSGGCLGKKIMGETPF